MNKSNFNARLGRLVTLILLGLTAAPLSAQTNAPPPIADRYLFIVDTSEAMRRRAPGVQKAVESLMRSSMAAQFQSGDTVGVWTFNEQLQAGRFPLQVWTPGNSDVVTSNVIRFIKSQTYTGASRFEAILPTLRRIVEQSPRLTILLVSDGDEPISGTRFDADIRRALASKYEAQKKARMPFVTVLRAARGRIASATVNLAPWPVDFPNFPPEPVVVEAPKPEAKPKPEPPRPVVPNLVIIGNKKPEPAAATNAPSTTNSPTPPVATPVVSEGQPTTATALTNPPTAAVGSNNLPIAAPTVTPTNTPVARLQSGTNVAPTTTAIAALAPTRTESTQAATSTPKATSAEAPGVTPIAKDKPTILFTETNSSAEVTVAAASTPGTLPWLLIAAGTIPIVLGIGVFFYLQRRARNAGHGSLITRSLDRNRK